MNDLRSVVRDRMVQLGLGQRALAKRMASIWGIEWKSAERRLSQWFSGGQDMTTGPFAEMLDVLGLLVGIGLEEKMLHKWNVGDRAQWTATDGGERYGVVLALPEDSPFGKEGVAAARVTTDTYGGRSDYSVYVELSRLRPRSVVRTDDFVILGLSGGDPGEAKAAVCLDLERGNAGEEWAALVRSDRVDELLERTGARLVRGPGAWDGSAFGDGNGGVVEIRDGQIVGPGLYAPAV